MRFRSVLNTCALNPHQYAKAWEIGADIGTIDLEDAVPNGRKDEARRLASPFFAEAPKRGTVRALRINSLRTEHGLRDVLALIENRAGPDLVFVPKISAAQELLLLEELLADKLPEIAFCAIIETARGLCGVEEIARATPRLRALIFGGADFAARLGIAMEWEALLYARSRLVTAARLAGIAAIDAPCFELASPARLDQEIEQGRRLGFDGKIAIHPHQVPVVNAGFTPSPEVLAKAREIVQRSRTDGASIEVVNGRMIGPPAVEQARRLLTSQEEGND